MSKANDPHESAKPHGEVATYIGRIRNAAKRAYAIAYARHLSGGPRPEPPASLSYMAAQAVRMQLEAMPTGVWDSEPVHLTYSREAKS